MSLAVQIDVKSAAGSGGHAIAGRHHVACPIVPGDFGEGTGNTSAGVCAFYEVAVAIDFVPIEPAHHDMRVMAEHIATNSLKSLGNLWRARVGGSATVRETRTGPIRKFVRAGSAPVRRGKN